MIGVASKQDLQGLVLAMDVKFHSQALPYVPVSSHRPYANTSKLCRGMILTIVATSIKAKGGTLCSRTEVCYLRYLSGRDLFTILFSSMRRRVESS